MVEFDILYGQTMDINDNTYYLNIARLRNCPEVIKVNKVNNGQQMSVGSVVGSVGQL